jgi:hypothetical protein
MKHGLRFAAASLLLAAGAVTFMQGTASAIARPPSCTLDQPTLECVGSTPSSITLRVCAGASGAPAGISIQWKLLSDWQVNGWSSGAGDSYSAISLSGNCGQGSGRWDLAANECQDVTIHATTVIDENATGCGASGDAYDLVCDTDYIFRIFAHNDPGPGGCDGTNPNNSPKTICRTAACPGGDCTFTWGYWKTHGPAGCNPPGHDNLWPAGNQAVGCLSLDQGALCSIFQNNPSACGKGVGANAVLILEHQLIAAELNRASGAVVCAFADAAIASANALLCGNEYSCVGTSSALGQQMLAVKDLLAAYNDDQCACPVSNKPLATPVGASASEKAAKSSKSKSWGELKVIYR